MKPSGYQNLRTWVPISVSALRSNYFAFRRVIPHKVKIMGVVKSNAYGHNLTECAIELERCGVDALAVDSLVEALTLRKIGVVANILVLGYTLPEMVAKALGKNIHLSISSLDSLRKFLDMPLAHRVPIHIKIDTGMHRQGFQIDQMGEVLLALGEARGTVQIAGVFTHLASANNPKDRSFTNKQITEFLEWKKVFLDAGYKPDFHATATGGCLAFPEAHFDMVRIGAGLYGIWPAPETRKIFAKRVPLRSVLSWKTLISEIKDIKRGEKISYDCTYTAKRKMRIAVCPIGYWHGYPRALSNNAEVLVRGVRAKVLGRVSMDMIVVDVSGVPKIKVGDEAVLIGRSGKEEVTAGELASHAGTIAYELLTRLNPLMKRVYR